MRMVVVISALLLAAAAVLVLRRVEAGPSVLDRVVGLDVLVSTMLAGFVLYSVWTGRSDFLAVMVVLSLVGFVGAVSLARFVAAESEEEARILTPQEVAELEERETAVLDALEEHRLEEAAAGDAMADAVGMPTADGVRGDDRSEQDAREEDASQRREGGGDR